VQQFGYGLAVGNNHHGHGLVEQLVQCGAGRRLLQLVQVLHLGQAQHLYPIGVDKVQVANQGLGWPLFFVRNQVVRAGTAGDPAQAQFVLIVLVQAAHTDIRHGWRFR